MKLRKVVNYFVGKFRNDGITSAISRHIILAEYPKCGGTYLHSLINQISLNLAKEQKINYSNNHISTLNISPDLDMLSRDNIYESINQFTSLPLLLKTHQCFNKKMAYVICLYRDPIESLVSFYNMLASYGRISDSFDNFVKGQKGIHRYCQFYSSYLKASQSYRILFINYQNTFGPPAANTLKDIFKLFYAFEVPEQLLKDSLQQCSKDNYKQVELLYQKYDYRRRASPKIGFISNSSSLSIDAVSLDTLEYVRLTLKSKLPLFYNLFY